MFFIHSIGKITKKKSKSNSLSLESENSFSSFTSIKEIDSSTFFCTEALVERILKMPSCRTCNKEIEHVSPESDLCSRCWVNKIIQKEKTRNKMREDCKKCNTRIYARNNNSPLTGYCWTCFKEKYSEKKWRGIVCDIINELNRQEHYKKYGRTKIL